jgi:WD40 repeat protein/Flp pilus assembly protein TadD
MATERTMHPLMLFFSYAPEDKALRDELDMHLKALRRTQLVETWEDRRVHPGGNREQEIYQAIEKADIILLLVSPYFINSEEYLSLLVKKVTQYQTDKREKVTIIPVLLRSCLWQETPLAQLDMLPRNGVPVTTWADRDEAWTDIAKNVRYVVANRLINEWKDQADTLYRERHYEEALAAYDRILQLDPTNIAASVCKGNVFLDLHRYADASRIYEQALLHRSSLEKSSLGTVASTRDNQLYEEALQVYNYLFRQNSIYALPTDRALETMLEDVPKSTSQEAVINDLNNAIRRNPVNPFLYYIKGTVYLELGRYGEALGAYEQAIHLKSDFEPSRIGFSKAVESISRQEYRNLDLLARQAVEEAHQLRDADTIPTQVTPKSHTYRGHSGGVCRIGWSPNGKNIASSSDDGTVRVWDATKGGGETFTYRGHTSSVCTIAWSPDGKWIASGSRDQTVQVWNANNGDRVLTYTGHLSDVEAVAWSPDGKRIASGSRDQAVQVWNANNGDRVLTYTGHLSDVEAVAWSPDGKWIASGSRDQTVQVWNANNGNRVLTYTGHLSDVESVVWSPDSKMLASGSRDQTVQIWNASNGSKLLTYTGHLSDVEAVAWSPDGKRIASGSRDKTIQVWDASNGNKVLTYTGHLSDVEAVAWSPDGKRIASGHEDGTVELWFVIFVKGL